MKKITSIIAILLVFVFDTFSQGFIHRDGKKIVTTTTTTTESIDSA